MSFGYPLWLWGLALLPLLAFFFARAEQRGAERLQQFVAARLLPQLAGTVNRGRRIFRFALLLVVLALVFVSLARPRWGYVYNEVRRKGLDLIVATDVSRSMLADDVAPSRLERVKLAAQDLLNDLQGDRVGLIAFAGRAFLEAPLTIDYDAVVDSINDLDTKTIPEGGTNIADAIRLAARTYGKSATGNRALIIFTDGEELDGDAVAAAKEAANDGVRIFTVGVGTVAGSLIPIRDESGGTEFVKDPQGQVVKSKLDEPRLREIAKATDGFYLHLENGPRTMQQLFNDGLSKMKVADINARLSREPIERYEWPLSAAILIFACALLINERRRTRLTTRLTNPAAPKRTLVPAALLLLAFVRLARADSSGLELYDAQKFPEAYNAFQKTLQENPGTRESDRLDFDAGAAAYKMKDYNKAMQSFSQALLSPNQQLQATSHYNLGNTLYERGEDEKSGDKKLTDWQNALQHYEETLKVQPQNREAKDNYDYVKKKIDELKQKKEQQQKQQQQQQQKKQNQQQQQQQQNQNEDQNQQSTPPSPTPPVQPDEAAKKAKAEADKAVLAHEFQRALRIMTDTLREDQTVQFYADYMKRLEEINGIKDSSNP